MCNGRGNKQVDFIPDFHGTSHIQPNAPEAFHRHFDQNFVGDAFFPESGVRITRIKQVAATAEQQRDAAACYGRSRMRQGLT